MVVVFSRGKLSPRAELEFAIHKRLFIVHYQPIVELATGICVGAEALVRWKRRDGSLVQAGSLHSSGGGNRTYRADH